MLWKSWSIWASSLNVQRIARGQTSENSKRPKVSPVSFLRSVREEEANWGQMKQGLDAWVFGVACRFSDPIPHLPDGKRGFRQRSLRGWLFLLRSALEKIHSKHSSLKLHTFIYFWPFSWLSQNYSSASCSDRQGTGSVDGTKWLQSPGWHLALTSI